MSNIIHLRLGDCLVRLQDLDDGSVGAIVSDPPYELSFMGKGWDGTGIVYDPVLWAHLYRVLVPGGVVKAFSATRTFHRMAAAIQNAGFTEISLEAWSYGSGFPKSLSIGKAIDKQAGAERELLGLAADFARDGARRKTDGGHVKPTYSPRFHDRWSQPVTASATDAARTWEGWGTALKPAWEPVLVGRKPA